VSLAEAQLIGPGEPERVRWMLDLVQARASLPGLKVLDLACRTGAFSTMLANAGADVLGIEGRQENLDHAPASTARFELADVRDASIETHGTFDVVLCLGILYHLGPEDAIGLLAAMRKMTERFAVIDTHIGADHASVVVDGHKYRGNWYSENIDHPWSALDNAQSWWFTAESLDDALHATGWVSITPIPGKSWGGETADRTWLVVE
jgi:SAM-dependent methyltransferase